MRQQEIAMTLRYPAVAAALSLIAFNSSAHWQVIYYSKISIITTVTTGRLIEKSEISIAVVFGGHGSLFQRHRRPSRDARRRPAQ